MVLGSFADDAVAKAKKDTEGGEEDLKFNPFSEALTDWYAVMFVVQDCLFRVRCSHFLAFSLSHLLARSLRRLQIPNTSSPFHSLLQQYYFVFTAVSVTTLYALMKKPSNGMGLMLVAGAGGSITDFANGWYNNCAPQVAAWKHYEHKLEQGEMRKIVRDTVPLLAEYPKVKTAPQERHVELHHQMKERLAQKEKDHDVSDLAEYEIRKKSNSSSDDGTT